MQKIQNGTVALDAGPEHLRLPGSTRYPSRLAAIVATDLSLSPHADTPLAVLVSSGLGTASRDAGETLVNRRRQLTAWAGASTSVSALAALAAVIMHL